MSTRTLLITTGLLLVGNLAAQLNLDSARKALAESLPEVSVARAERYLAANPQLTEKEKTEALLLLGESYLRSGQNEKALTTLAKVSDSQSSARNYWQGMALAHQGKTPQALEKFAQVASDHPLYRSALFNGLELEVSQNETDLAFEFLEKLRAFDPKYLSSQLTQIEAQLYLTANEPDKARNALLTLTDQKTFSPEQEILAGKTELAAMESDAALNAFAKALAPETPPKLRVLALLGQCDAHLQASDYEPALRSLLQLLKMGESENYLPFIAARMDLLTDRATEREELITPLTTFVGPATLGEDSNLQSSQKLLACYSLARLSEPERAQELLQRIITLDPTSELAARAYPPTWQVGVAKRRLRGGLAITAKCRRRVPGLPLRFCGSRFVSPHENARRRSQSGHSTFRKSRPAPRPVVLRARPPEPGAPDSHLKSGRPLVFHRGATQKRGSQALPRT